MNPLVAERGVAYIRGNNTALEAGARGTYGVERRGDTMRIVWYFDASDQTRAFTISYTLRGVAVGYDDVVDVNLKVWGDEWDVPLGRLTATEHAPGKILRGWGHPVYVRGDVQLSGSTAVLRALDVPAHQFVELRTLLPRGAFSSTAGMKVKSGTGLEKIVADEAPALPRSERALVTQVATQICRALMPSVVAADGPVRNRLVREMKTALTSYIAARVAPAG